MRITDLIEKKKHGLPLAEEEIGWMISSYVDGSITDYQMSAMLMAIWFSGMNETETLCLTQAMEHSGDTVDLSSLPGIKSDKHSSGGVGDKTSIALIPWVASCGAVVAKMSGRGLGFTGGTLDKLESFTGFRTALSNEEFLTQVKNIGCAIAAQSENLTPADKKLYALRDATATVDNLSLISSSIMSKKLASGADAIVLDVTCGRGAFMRTLDDARALAKTMIRIGKRAGRRMCAVISNMDEPLGHAVGNILEVQEAIAVLRGEGPADVEEICYALGSRMLMLSDLAGSEDEARDMMRRHLADGSALRKLAQLVEAQGGDPQLVWHPERMPLAERREEITAETDGIISAIQCDEIGNASMILGGGRLRKEDDIDLSVGVILEKKIGSKVVKGERVATLIGHNDERMDTAVSRVREAVLIVSADDAHGQDVPLVKPRPVVLEVLE